MKYIEENLKEFEVGGILRAHQDGYLGEGISMMEWESCNPELPFYDGMVRDPLNYGDYGDLDNSHGNKVVDIKHQAAPKSIIYIGSNAQSSNGTGTFYEKTVPFILKEKVNLVGASLGGLNNKHTRQTFQAMIDNGTIVSFSAGNKGRKGLGGHGRTPQGISVGAVGYKDRNGEIYYKSYSSRGPELDYTDFSGLYIHDARNPSRTYPMEGTSFSYPLFEGKLALTQEMFLKNAGRMLYQDEMIMFLNDHLIDLGEVGWDEYFGKGLYVIPKYNEINYKKYLIRGDKQVYTPPKKDTDKDKVDYFSDDDGKWHEEYNNRLAALGILNGYGDGTIRADQKPTRGEINKMICTALDVVDDMIKEALEKRK